MAARQDRQDHRRNRDRHPSQKSSEQRTACPEIQGLPDRFSTLSGIGSSILSLYLNDLPMDYYQNYPKAISAITKDDVLRVAKKYVDLDHLNIVIVGDRKLVEPGLRGLGMGEPVEGWIAPYRQVRL